MEELRDYIRKDWFCRIVFIMLLMGGLLRMATRDQFVLLKPSLDLLFVLFGIRILMNKELMKKTGISKIIILIICGYSFEMIWHLLNLLK